MESVNYFWSCVPRAFQRTIGTLILFYFIFIYLFLFVYLLIFSILFKALHNELLRTVANVHHGYEAQFQLDKCGFMFVFSELSHAINFCVSVQLSLLKVAWPDDILKCPPYVTFSNI